KYDLLQKELIQALGDWEKKETDDMYVVVVRLEACKIPDQLANFQKFEALDDLKIFHLVRLLRVLHGKATRTLDFLPAKLEYLDRQISPEGSTHYDIGVTIPQFNLSGSNLLASVDYLIEGTVRDILDMFLAQAEPGLSPEEIRALGLEN